MAKKRKKIKYDPNGLHFAEMFADTPDDLEPGFMPRDDLYAVWPGDEKEIAA